MMGSCGLVLTVQGYQISYLTLIRFDNQSMITLRHLLNR